MLDETRHVAVADHDAGDVDREERAAVQRAGRAEHEHRAGDEEERGQAARERQLAHQRRDRDTTARAEQRTHAELERDLHAAERVGRGKVTGEQRRQQHGDRIVRTRFDLERRADARAKLQAARAQQEEHGGGIGRGDDRAEYQRLQRRQRQQPVCHRAGERRRDQDAEGREQ